MAPEALTASALLPLLTKVASGAAEASKGKLSKLRDEMSVKFKLGFGEYTQSQIAKFSHVKTIIGSHNPLDFFDVYVNLYLESNKIQIRDDDFLNVGEVRKKFVFTATAGSGKSMLMRYLFFMYLKNQSNRLPIFIELRDLNEVPEKSILDFASEAVSEFIEGFTAHQLRYAISKGLIVLFFDGFDEVDHDRRNKRARELNKLADRYENLIIYVSSRPDPIFSGWNSFFVYNLLSFTENQVRLLIKKVPYEESIKELFVKKLDNGLYETHKEFLVNPLLTLMMLITLEQFAEVPGKIHLFYEYAFEALFARHDTTKNGFQRKRNAEIALDDYRRLFAYFCTMTYMKESFRFSEAAALEFLHASVNSSQIEIKKLDMLEDLVQCTCMLVRDGLELEFSHRSFQEYFVAYFFSRIKIEEFARVATKLIERGTFDNVFHMISEMNTEKFEEAWALPQLQGMWDRIYNVDAQSNPIELIAKIFGSTELKFSDRLGLSVAYKSDIPLGYARICLYRIYGIFDKIHYNLPNEDSSLADVMSFFDKGGILESDPRFAEFKNEERSQAHTMIDLKVTPEDNEWIRLTHLGRFVAEEKSLLKNLLGDIKCRVEKRKIGISDILNF